MSDARNPYAAPSLSSLESESRSAVTFRGLFAGTLSDLKAGKAGILRTSLRLFFVALCLQLTLTILQTVVFWSLGPGRMGPLSGFFLFTSYLNFAVSLCELAASAGIAWSITPPKRRAFLLLALGIIMNSGRFWYPLIPFGLFGTDNVSIVIRYAVEQTVSVSFIVTAMLIMARVANNGRTASRVTVFIVGRILLSTVAVVSVFLQIVVWPDVSWEDSIVIRMLSYFTMPFWIGIGLLGILIVKSALVSQVASCEEQSAVTAPPNTTSQTDGE